MLSLDTLRAFGADVDDGLKRCLNNEAFYLMMIRKALPGISLSELKSALDGGDLTKAFELCHAMKGVLANLSLTPLLNPVSEMTELLRSRTACDYAPYVAQLEEQYTRLTALCAD